MEKEIKETHDVDLMSHFDALDNVPYCNNCGNDKLDANGNYACGRHYKCPDCGNDICWSEQ